MTTGIGYGEIMYRMSVVGRVMIFVAGVALGALFF